MVHAPYQFARAATPARYAGARAGAVALIAIKSACRRVLTTFWGDHLRRIRDGRRETSRSNARSAAAMATHTTAVRTDCWLNRRALVSSF